MSTRLKRMSTDIPPNMAGQLDTGNMGEVRDPNVQTSTNARRRKKGGENAKIISRPFRRPNRWVMTRIVVVGL